MSRTREDKSLSMALCVSLVAHAVIGLLILREQIAYLTRQLDPKPLATSATRPHLLLPEDAPGVAIAPPPEPDLGPDFARADPNPPNKPEPTDPDDNSEWGEKNGKGYAINATPGKDPLTARKGLEDQAFASRDPEGPLLNPDEPSPSTALPGQNGDGRKPAPDPLANQGTQGAATPPPIVGQMETTSATPPPPVIDRTATIRKADDPALASAVPGPAASVLPEPERASNVQDDRPPGDRDGPSNDAPRPRDATPIFPIKQRDAIGIATDDPAYPDEVEAFARPPGDRSELGASQPLIELAAASGLATPDTSLAPRAVPATVALSTSPRQPEEMAIRVGAWDPSENPSVVEALTRPPGDENLEGSGATTPLTELARALDAASPRLQEAATVLAAVTPRPDELAEQAEPAPAAVAVNNAATGSPAKATGGLPGPPIAAADPAVDTGQELDPFAKIPSIEFHNGEVAARSGRQVKPVRPQLSDAARRDLFAKQFPTIVAKVRIDKDGKVTDVRMVQGSGSEAIDMPVYRCLWNWYFEPPKDKAGKPIEDVQLVAIHWS